MQGQVLYYESLKDTPICSTHRAGNWLMPPHNKTIYDQEQQKNASCRAVRGYVERGAARSPRWKVPQTDSCKQPSGVAFAPQRSVADGRGKLGRRCVQHMGASRKKTERPLFLKTRGMYARAHARALGVAAASAASSRRRQKRAKGGVLCMHCRRSALQIKQTPPAGHTRGAFAGRQASRQAAAVAGHVPTATSACGGLRTRSPVQRVGRRGKPLSL